MQELDKIQLNLENKDLKQCKFKIVTDVNNPLLGKNGASYVFAKQKGATDSQI